MFTITELNLCPSYYYYVRCTSIVYVLLLVYIQFTYSSKYNFSLLSFECNTSLLSLVRTHCSSSLLPLLSAHVHCPLLQALIGAATDSSAVRKTTSSSSRTCPASTTSCARIQDTVTHLTRHHTCLTLSICPDALRTVTLQDYDICQIVA